MSAFLVSAGHINRVVSTANAWHVTQTPQEDGQMLWNENARSVAYLYEGRHGTDAEPETFAWRPFAHPVLTPVEMIKALHCLSYQSCECPDWGQSRAKRWIDNAEACAISRLPGYDAAPWGYGD